MTFLPFKLLASDDPEFFEDYALQLFLRAALINNHMFLEFRDMPTVERDAEIARITEKLAEMSH